MHIQQVDSVFDITWNDPKNNQPALTYHDIFFQNEFENSHYILNYSNVDILFKNFSEAKEQSQILAENNLPFPAFEQALKASHILNLLDARQAISATERATYILQIRQLVKMACELIIKV
jgi:glycyl-tRNA synthetase alpha chain